MSADARGRSASPPTRSVKDATQWEPEPRWQALIATLSVVGLFVALPPYLTLGPQWLFTSLLGVMIAAVVVAHRAGWHRTDHALGIVLNAALTLATIASLALLIDALPTHKESATELLLSAASLWVTNILVFALWYWRLDAGGPHDRDRRAAHAKGAFLFPQMTMPQGGPGTEASPRWTPTFVDYLFLAFNTSTAFSPTDTPVLTRWGKILMMCQASISLIVLALLAARAVNTL
jgi:hypothetical protein